MQRTTVEGDFRCRRCGYNVRGLQPDGRCPECNAPVIAALHPYLIEFADPQWLRRLEAGTSGAFSAGMVLLYSAPAGMMIAWMPGPESIRIVVFVVAALLFCLFLGRAIWSLSEPNSAIAPTEPSISSRKLFRSLVVTVPCTVTLASIAGMLWGGSATLAVIMLGSPFGLLGLISIWGYARYMRTLAEYIDLEYAVKRISFHLAGYTISWAMFAFGCVGMIYTTGPLICLFLAGLVGVLGFGALLVFAVPDYIGVYLEQIQAIAEQNWQQATDQLDYAMSPNEPSDLKINGANG